LKLLLRCRYLFGFGEVDGDELADAAFGIVTPL
jgi:hypothetical protein